MPKNHVLFTSEISFSWLIQAIFFSLRLNVTLLHNQSFIWLVYLNFKLQTVCMFINICYMIIYLLSLDFSRCVDNAFLAVSTMFYCFRRRYITGVSFCRIFATSWQSAPTQRICRTDQVYQRAAQIDIYWQYPAMPVENQNTYTGFSSAMILN